MASLQKEPTSTFHIVIRIDGQRFKRSFQTKNVQEARLRKDELQETLELINRGRISVPDDCKTIDFLLKRSVKTGKPRKADEQVPNQCKKLPFRDLGKSTLKLTRTHRSF